MQLGEEEPRHAPVVRLASTFPGVHLIGSGKRSSMRKGTAEARIASSVARLPHYFATNRPRPPRNEKTFRATQPIVGEHCKAQRHSTQIFEEEPQWIEKTEYFLRFATDACQYCNHATLQTR